MAQYPSTKGMGYAGSFRSDQIPRAADNEQQLIYVYDNGDGKYLYSDGTSWQTFGSSEQVAPDWKVGVIGASTDERENVLYGVVNSSWSRRRINGVGTATFLTSTTLDTVTNLGRPFRLTADKFPQIEGTFQVQTIVPSSGGHLITYIDDRDDLAASAIPSSTQIYYVDPAFYTVSSGSLAHTSMCMGGRISPVIVATGGTNIVDDWADPTTIQYNRVDQLLSQGPFGAIIIGSGIIGNAVLAGYGEDIVYAALDKLCKRLRGAGRRIYVETMTADRNVAANSSSTIRSTQQGQVFTAANRLNRRIWRDLPKSNPHVKVMAVNEAVTTSYLATGGAQADIDNAWPLVSIMNSDGTHKAYGASRLIGIARARAMMDDFLAWAPEEAIAPDNVWNATFADTSGNPNFNAHSAWWDKTGTAMPTISSGASVTGLAPQGCTIAVASVSGSMSGTSSVVLNQEGGYDWLTLFSDTGAGSAQGETVTWTDAGFTGQKLLGQLKANPGKTLDIVVPVCLSDFPEDSVVSWGCALFLDYGAGLLPHCGVQNIGLFRQAAIGRAMDAGFDGPLRFPVTTVPLDAASLQDAQLQFTLTATPNTSVGTALQFVWRRGTRVDIY